MGKIETYFCDCCQKQVKHKYGLYPFKYAVPQSWSYSSKEIEICEECTRKVYTFITNEVKEFN